jgi:thiamine-monophosphate kinase
MDEFDRIAAFFAPLSDDTHGLGLTDDAAIIPQSESQVITKDIMLEGTHFLANSDPTDLAFKLVSVNVSDLAAMGATPSGYLLGLGLPKTTTSDWFSAFSQGLKQAIACYGGLLLGGDTTAHEGRVMLSLTAIGVIEKGRTAITRKGAKPGDLLVVSGVIGDAWIGLEHAKNNVFPMLSEMERDSCLARYYRPQARAALGKMLQGIASSICDISDGIIADLGHILRASHVGAALHVDDIPLSQAGKKLLHHGHVSRERLLTFGDDYELLFTIPNEKKSALQALSKKSGVVLTMIGEITQNPALTLYDKGQKVDFTQAGYQHFS